MLNYPSETNGFAGKVFVDNRSRSGDCDIKAAVAGGWLCVSVMEIAYVAAQNLTVGVPELDLAGNVDGQTVVMKRVRVQHSILSYIACNENGWRAGKAKVVGCFCGTYHNSAVVCHRRALSSILPCSQLVTLAKVASVVAAFSCAHHQVLSVERRGQPN